MLALASFAAIAANAMDGSRPAAARGCVWDQTGCTQGCDTSLMETRCGLLSHDMAACVESPSRCAWSYAEAELDIEEDDTDDQFSSLGCIWDQSGCTKGCNVEAMLGRCSQYANDMTSCLSDDGQQARCQWGKYNERMIDDLEELKLANTEQEQEQDSILFAGLNMNVLDSEVSSVDTLLVIGGLLTGLVVLQQGRKYCKQRSSKLLVAREIQYGTIQLIDSHAEDANV